VRAAASFGNRAWSHQQNLLRTTVRQSTNKTTESVGIASQISSFPKNNPFLFQLGIATLKTSAADLIVQVSSFLVIRGDIDLIFSFILCRLC
jgi:hypothetical protein